MTTETLENGDYITCERSAYPNGVCGQEIKELYKDYNFNYVIIGNKDNLLDIEFNKGKYNLAPKTVPAAVPPEPHVQTI